MEPSVRSMQTLHSTPGALRLLAISIIARLPLAMLGIGLLVQAVHLTGSFTAAGVVAGANAIAIGVGGPLLGKLVDRRGQTVVLITSGCVSGGLLSVFGALPVGTPLPLLDRCRSRNRCDASAGRRLPSLAAPLARARRVLCARHLRRSRRRPSS